jgi:hypothetical protein
MVYLSSVKILCVVFIVITLSQYCYAHQPDEGKVFGTIGPFVNHSQSVYTPEANYTPFFLGFGILAEGDLSNHGGGEIGLFYFNKLYKRAMANGFVVAQVAKIDIPMGYRYWFNPSFSGALGFSTSFSVGNPQVNFSNVTGDQSTSATNIADYGIDFSVQWEFWTNGLFSALVDGRYSLSISTNPGEDANQYGVLVGIKYMIQEKDKDREREKELENEEDLEKEQEK